MVDLSFSYYITDHFILRAMERIGCSSKQARTLGKGIIWSIENNRKDLVDFVCRVDKKGRRLFLFRYAPTKDYYYALVDTISMRCITVMPPGFQVKLTGESKLLVLGEKDL